MFVRPAERDGVIGRRTGDDAQSRGLRSSITDMVKDVTHSFDSPNDCGVPVALRGVRLLSLSVARQAVVFSMGVAMRAWPAVAIVVVAFAPVAAERRCFGESPAAASSSWPAPVAVAAFAVASACTAASRLLFRHRLRLQDGPFPFHHHPSAFRHPFHRHPCLPYRHQPFAFRRLPHRHIVLALEPSRPPPN